MKIEGPRGPQGTSATRRTASASVADAAQFRGLMAGAGEAEETGAAAATQTIASIDILLAAQAAPDPAERAARGRMTRRSAEVLDLLDKIKLGMLAGTLTVGDMIDIADVVASHREKIADPQLTAVLDEVDLRAQVEIAKMRLSLDGKTQI